MLGPGSYEEPLLSWYQMHELSRCRIALYIGYVGGLFWVLLSNYCTDLCN